MKFIDMYSSETYSKLIVVDILIFTLSIFLAATGALIMNNPIIAGVGLALFLISAYSYIIICMLEIYVSKNI